MTASGGVVAGGNALLDPCMEFIILFVPLQRGFPSSLVVYCLDLAVVA